MSEPWDPDVSDEAAEMAFFRELLLGTDDTEAGGRHEGDPTIDRDDDADEFEEMGTPPNADDASDAHTSASTPDQALVLVPSDDSEDTAGATSADADPPRVTDDPSIPLPVTRPLSARLSGAVSLVATGAMVTVLVLWATGTFDAPSQRELASASREEPAVVADSNAADAAPLTGADAGEAPPPPPPQEAQLPDPSFIEIPAIGVRARVIPLGTEVDGSLEVPTDFAQTGWWQDGPEPGELGPSVIAGHVDSVNGPAVFYGLEELVYDDAITVTRGDGTSSVFAVRSTLNVEKNEFPSDLVYSDTPGAELRLITCDGGFSEGSYTGNLIITAELIDERPGPETGALF